MKVITINFRKSETSASMSRKAEYEYQRRLSGQPEPTQKSKRTKDSTKDDNKRLIGSLAGFIHSLEDKHDLSIDWGIDSRKPSDFKEVTIAVMPNDETDPVEFGDKPKKFNSFSDFLKAAGKFRGGFSAAHKLFSIGSTTLELQPVTDYDTDEPTGYYPVATYKLKREDVERLFNGE